jgi:hypothetical protein
MITVGAKNQTQTEIHSVLPDKYCSGDQMRWEGPAAPKEDEKKYTEGFGGEI